MVEEEEGCCTREWLCGGLGRGCVQDSGCSGLDGVQGECTWGGEVWLVGQGRGQMVGEVPDVVLRSWSSFRRQPEAWHPRTVSIEN